MEDQECAFNKLENTSGRLRTTSFESTDSETLSCEDYIEEQRAAVVPISVTEKPSDSFLKKRKQRQTTDFPVAYIAPSKRQRTE